MIIFRPPAVGEGHLFAQIFCFFNFKNLNLINLVRRLPAKFLISIVFAQSRVALREYGFAIGQRVAHGS